MELIQNRPFNLDLNFLPHGTANLQIVYFCFIFRMLSQLYEQLWADWIWFPQGHGWSDLKDHDGKVFPKTQDLWATLPIALCFLIIRQVFER